MVNITKKKMDEDLNLPEYTKILNRFGDFIHSNKLSRIQTKSALVLLKDELTNGCILSYNEQLDELIKNVIIPKKIVEFSGHFESTTPICLRLCMSVQLPKSCGGCGSEALYLSTNGNFFSEKLREIAVDFAEEYSNNIDEFNADFLLNHIYYTGVNSPTEFMACIFEMELFIKQKHIGLLVIDSISYILRQVEHSERFKIINRIFQMLRYLSDKYNIAVIITNFCTFRINGDDIYRVPSFGDSFYHLVNSRVSFTKIGTNFHAKLNKHVANKEEEVVFQL